MKTLRLFLKRMKAEKSYLILIILLSIFIVVGYFSYAMFTVNKEQKEAIRIITGTLTGELKVDNVETDKLVVNQGETKEFTVTLRNNNDRTARYLLYYIGTLPDGLEAGYVVEDSAVVPPEDKGRNITKETTETYKIKVKNSTTSSQTIQLKLDVGLEKFDLTVPNSGHLFEQILNIKNFIQQYTNKENAEFTNITENKMFIYHHENEDQLLDWNEEELTDYRYIGANPNNYIKFNNELWRIIGVTKVKTSKNILEDHIKIIRTNGIKGQNDFEQYIADMNNTSKWATTSLARMLNGIYYNSEIGECYSGNDGPITTTCDFKNGPVKGLDEQARNMIDSNVIWNINFSHGWNTASQFYITERQKSESDFQYEWSKENDPDYYNGIGLMYPSDWGFAVGGDTREICLEKSLSGSDMDYRKENCKDNDWLTPKGIDYWTITSEHGPVYDIFYVIRNGGYLGSDFVRIRDNVPAPVIYLKSSVYIVKDSSTDYGSESNPFRIINFE